MPALTAALALEKMARGSLLALRVDDPAAFRDVPLWCREAGHRVLAVKTFGAARILYIQKGLVKK